MNPSYGLPENVHIIPLGHEIDRAVQPFMTNKTDRVHLLAVPPEAELDPVMKEKQVNYTKQVTARLTKKGIFVEYHAVDMFDILDVLKKVSRIIVKEKEKGNNIYVNMSACGRKTSFAVTIAALVHNVMAYYVPADGYATGENASKETKHGMSIVDSGRIEPLQQFHIMMPDETNIMLLAELYRRKMLNKPFMKSDDIITFFHAQKVHGFDIKPEEKHGLERSKFKRTLLNRINRMHLEVLAKQNYIKKEKVGKEFFVSIDEAGEHIACVSGLID